jgi:membrane protein implicated in regulation of membrane protease activity
MEKFNWKRLWRVINDTDDNWISTALAIIILLGGSALVVLMISVGFEYPEAAGIVVLTICAIIVIIGIRRLIKEYKTKK